MQYQVFNDEQLAQLNGKLNQALVKTRKGSGGTTLAYIEGHTAIATANRIFGYGNWAFEPLECNMVTLVDPATCEPIGVTYRAKVQLTVRGCVAPIVEVGSQPCVVWNVNEVIRKRRAAAAKYGRRAQSGEHMPDEIASAQSTIVEAHEAAEKGAVRCEMCGVHQRSIVWNREGLPYMVYLAACHVHHLDQQQPTPLQGQYLRALCPRCHSSYDSRFKELEHQVRMHQLLKYRFISNRFMAVI